MHKTGAPKLAATGSLDEMMARFERELISSLLEQNHFSLTKTAEQLKISRHALRYRMQRLNIADAAEARRRASRPSDQSLIRHEHPLALVGSSHSSDGRNLQPLALDGSLHEGVARRCSAPSLW